MARGGYIKPSVAINQLCRVLGSRAEARRVILEALESGALTARGRRVLDPTLPNADEPMVLIDLGNPPDEPVRLAAAGDIRASYWEGISSSAMTERVWTGEFFYNDTIRGDANLGYQQVGFAEAEVNDLIRFHSKTFPKQRMRPAAWNEWVAAVAILAAEGKIDPVKSVASLLDAVADKLADWGLDDRERATVTSAASTIRARFKSHPPDIEGISRVKPSAS